MASAPPSPYQVEVTIASARDLKNINWRHGPLSPYAVVWVDPNAKCSTQVDKQGDSSPYWDEKIVLPLTAPIEDSTLFIDIVHANADPDTKPLIGSARLKLREIVDDVGIGESVHRTLQLKRPSGRPHGKLDVNIVVRQNLYRAPDPYGYGAPPPGSRSAPYSYQDPYQDPYRNPYSAPPSGGYPYSSAPPPSGYPVAGPPSGYPYSSAPPPTSYPVAGPPSGYPYSSAPPPTYQYDAPGQNTGGYGEQKKKSSKFGVGTGIAVGAVAGVLGGLALAEGADYIEDKIEDHVAERVEDDLADGDYGDDDF